MSWMREPVMTSPSEGAPPLEGVDVNAAENKSVSLRPAVAHPFHGDMCRVVLPHEANLYQSSPPDTSASTTSLASAPPDCQWLFAKHRLAGGNASPRQLGMKTVWRRNHHCFDFRRRMSCSASSQIRAPPHLAAISSARAESTSIIAVTSAAATM